MLVIGASGLDWGGFDRLTRSGALPNLGRMRQKGAAGWLTGAPAVIGPAPFATMVAGQQPEVHGLWRAREAWAGGVRPLSRASWRAPPAWAYLEAAGIRTATVAWPGNRPGDSGPGSHIDEDFAEPSSHDPADWALPLHCAPVGLRTALRARRVHPRNITASMLRPLVPDLADIDAVRDLDLPAISVAMASAASIQSAATLFLESDQADVLFVRQPWLGRIRAVFDHRRDARMAHVVPAAWRLLDGFVGGLVNAAGPDAQVILVSPGWTFLPGVVLASGERLTPDAAFQGASILDIAPTVLGQFGLMVPGLPGRPISIAAPAGSLQPAPKPGPVPERRPEARTMHVVRKAGYPPAPRASAAWRAQGLAALAWMVLERDPAAAGKIAGAALRLDPACILGLRVQVRAKVAIDDLEGLETLGQALLEAAPGQPWGPLALGAWHVLRGKTPQAAPWLAKVEATADPSTLMTLAAVWLAANRPANAMRAFRSVLALDPLNVSAEMGVAMAAAAQRDFASAELALERALGQDPGRSAIHLLRATVYSKTGQPLKARQSAETAVTLGASRSQAESARRGRPSL